MTSTQPNEWIPVILAGIAAVSAFLGLLQSRQNGKNLTRSHEFQMEWKTLEDEEELKKKKG